MPMDSKAIVNLKDKYELEIGENEIKIDITAADGSRASYILNITRKKVLSNNSRLANIKIIGYKINFKPEVTSYDLRIKDEDEKLDIYTVAEDPFATLEIEGNKSLVDGSIIKVNVKAEDGSYTRYIINIVKSRKSNLLPIIITIIILSGLLAVCIMQILKKKKIKEEKLIELQEKIKEEGEASDSLGVDMDIEASDYEVEKSDADSDITNNLDDSINDDEKKDIV